MPDVSHLLEPVGLTSADSSVYLHLLSHGHATVAELAQTLKLPTARLRKSLDTLTGAGLCNRLVGRPPRYVAAPPEVAVDALVLHHHQELDELRARARELALRAVTPASQHGELIEIIQGAEAILRTLATMELGARDEVLIIDCPPYLEPVTLNTHELQALSRGVRYRAIYRSSQLSNPDRLQELDRCRAAGEQARSLSAPGMKMIIVDREYALIPLSFSGTSSDTRLLVRANPIVESLLLCFETLWERSTPLGPDYRPEPDDEITASSEPSDRDRQILQLLASGAKDRAIARTLGVNERTVVRRTSELLKSLNAETRFQAGVQAARRGWL